MLSSLPVVAAVGLGVRVGSPLGGMHQLHEVSHRVSGRREGGERERGEMGWRVLWLSLQYSD